MRLIKPFVMLLLLACCPILAAQEPPPKVIKGSANKIIVIDSEVKGEVIWRLDKRLRDPGSSYKDLANKRLVIVAPGGVYEVLAVDRTAGAFLEWTIIVEGGPGPGPNPDPVPETLETRLKLTFEVDKASGKGDATLKSKLATLYKGLAEFTDSQIIKTVEQAHAVQHGAVDALLMGNLPTTAKAADDYIHILIPEADDVALTKVIRDRYKAALLDVGKALGAEPGPGPTPISGFRVIFVSESGSNMTKEQLNILNSTAIRDYLNKKTAKTGTRSDYRFWDKDVDVSKETDTFKKLWETAKSKIGVLPQMIIFSDQGMVILPLTNEQDILAILKKYGGA